MYFNLMFRNCRGKLERRVQVLQTTTNYIEKPPETRGKKQRSDKTIPKTALPKAVEHVYTKLRENVGTAPPPNLVYSHADTEAMKLANETDIYSALIKVLESMCSYLHTPLCAGMLHNLSAQAWIIGNSPILEKILVLSPTSLAILDASRKMGIYLRGTARLHSLILDRVWRDSLKTVKFIAVPSSEPRNPDFCHDWYRVIETIYTRRETWFHERDLRTTLHGSSKSC
jgi:hypothetical protein